MALRKVALSEDGGRVMAGCGQVLQLNADKYLTIREQPDRRQLLLS